jgi:flagellar protein FliS
LSESIKTFSGAAVILAVSFPRRGLEMLQRNAMNAYRQAEQDFLVEGSDGHGLVQLLFNELLVAIEETSISIELDDLAARSASSSKALSILYVLNSSLDFEKGGEVALSLEQLYGWSRRQLIEAIKENSRERLANVYSSIADIADAWASIRDKIN